MLQEKMQEETQIPNGFQDDLLLLDTEQNITGLHPVVDAKPAGG